MAVESNLLLPPRLIGNREMLGMNCVDGIGGGYGIPLSRQSMATEMMLPVYGDGMCDTHLVPAPPAMDSGSSLTYGAVAPPSRKRCRENVFTDNGSLLSFLGEDLSLLFQLQQMEIDRLIAHHTEKMRAEVEVRRRRCSRRIAAAVEESVMKKLKDKDEEIEKMGKLNWALEERVKSLSFENQIWKELASTSEATANALRSNLQQVLEQVQDVKRCNQNDDAESSCGSSSAVNPSASPADRRLCRSCHSEESSVFLLPCRHLSLCTMCAASHDTCPVCNAVKTGSVCLNLAGV